MRARRVLIGSVSIRDTFPGKYPEWKRDRKSTRLNSSHSQISYAVFCLKKKKKREHRYIGKLQREQKHEEQHRLEGGRARESCDQAKDHRGLWRTARRATARHADEGTHQ